MQIALIDISQLRVDSTALRSRVDYIENVGRQLEDANGKLADTTRQLVAKHQALRVSLKNAVQSQNDTAARVALLEKSLENMVSMHPTIVLCTSDVRIHADTFDTSWRAALSTAEVLPRPHLEVGLLVPLLTRILALATISKVERTSRLERKCERL